MKNKKLIILYFVSFMQCMLWKSNAFGICLQRLDILYDCCMENCCFFVRCLFCMCSLELSQLSRLMGKPTICIGENKDADQLRGNRAFVFATRIVQFLFYLNTKFQDSSSFLCLYRTFCVRTVRKPHCWFSHEKAQ